jgi:tetratricopeptide (TPR) repeat protein
MSQTPKSLTELFSRYLRRQMAAQAEGLGLADPDGQVVPHEAIPVQPVDPRLAWEDALTVVRFSQTDVAAEMNSIAAPPDWPSLVATQEPAIAVPFCIGNYPQLVRNLEPFLNGGDPSALRFRSGLGSEKSRPISVPSTLLRWAKTMRRYLEILIAAGVMRLARRFEDASELLDATEAMPANWQWLRANEEAALAWHRGNAEQALTLWQTQKSSVPVLFNRGMAALFLGHSSDARVALDKAVSRLPETSAWHHLGHLYLALTAARS